MTTWKHAERKIAELVCGERIPITGRQRGDVADIKHAWLSIEAKHRKALPEWLHDAMDQAQAAKTDGQLPAVILHEKQMEYQRSLVLIRLDDFIEWFGN